eukprot:12921725-Prorocentrum_lima.AAC.1
MALREWRVVDWEVSGSHVSSKFPLGCCECGDGEEFVGGDRPRVKEILHPWADPDTEYSSVEGVALRVVRRLS